MDGYLFYHRIPATQKKRNSVKVNFLRSCTYNIGNSEKRSPKKGKIQVLQINQSTGYIQVNQSINERNSGQSINQS